MKSVLVVMAMAALLGITMAIESRINNLEICGKRPFSKADPGPDPLAKVVGGNVSRAGDHGWQVALIRNGAFICGGSIINERTILCAAHCTQLTNPGAYVVVRTHVRNPYDSWSQSKTVVRIVNHPSYSSSTFNNDISLIFLREDFDLTPDQVNSVCLAEKDPRERQEAIATGWGSTQSGGSVQNILREAKMPITDEAAIRVQYGSSYNPVTMIAAAYQGDGLDTCQGDSGGPLSCGYDYDNDGTLDRLEQVGIVSWGYGCGGIGIYTRCSTYIKWIENQIANFYRDMNLE